MKKRVEPTALLGLALVLLFSTAGFSHLGEQRYFEVDRGPSTGLLEVVIRPEAVTVQTDYVLYGDGRLEIQSRGTRPGDTAREELSWQYTEDETEAILRDFVDSGLVGFEPQIRLDELRARGRPLPRITDGESVSFTIHLLSYEEGGDDWERPITWAIRLENPRDIAGAFPDVPEFAALRRLLLRFDDAHRGARRGARR